MKRTLILVLMLVATNALAFGRTGTLLQRAWPYDPLATIPDIGRGVAVVFSPDLSLPGNCHFYQALGFACFEDTDWSRVLAGIRTYNIANPDRTIRTVALETHGTNGHGLKLQKSYDPKAERSYISVGALQERLEPDGIAYIIISACNSQRLLRPMIYRSLDPHPGDKLFLPATCGIHNASAWFNPRRSHVAILTPAVSHIETTLVGSLSELTSTTRKLITASAKLRGIRIPKQFAMSDILIQMLIRDSRLELKTGGYADEYSAELKPVAASEELFQQLVRYLDIIATQQDPQQLPTTAERAAAVKPSGR